MCAIITALMFMAALFSVYASEDKATATPRSAAKSPDGDSESPYQHLSIKEFVAAISKYDETNYLDLQVIVAREANSDRRYFIYKELYRIF
jgi:hypothetical protein